MQERNGEQVTQSYKTTGTPEHRRKDVRTVMPSKMDQVDTDRAVAKEYQTPELTELGTLEGSTGS